MDNRPLTVTMNDLPAIPLPGLPLPAATAQMLTTSPALFLAMRIFMSPEIPATASR